MERDLPSSLYWIGGILEGVGGLEGGELRRQQGHRHGRPDLELYSSRKFSAAATPSAKPSVSCIPKGVMHAADAGFRVASTAVDAFDGAIMAWDGMHR